MKFNILIPLLFVYMGFLSCNNFSGGSSSDTKNSQVQPPKNTQDKNKNLSKEEIKIIQTNLEGKWKETAYPYRLADFKDSMVKFTEEGILEEPSFKKFYISRVCPFEVNNMRNLKGDDIILVIQENKTCEKLLISPSTLTLNGYNENTGKEYNIVYAKMN